MKRTTVTLTCALLVVAAQASDAKDSCANSRNISREIMEYRQEGMSKSDVQGKISASGSGDNTVMARMLVEAYEQPVVSVDAMKRQAITDFADRWYNFCVSLRR
jgi:hypothetical protein